MTSGVNTQDTASPGQADEADKLGNKEHNFRRLEADRDRAKEAQIRAEMQNEQLRREFETLKDAMKPDEVDPLDSEDIDPDLKRRLQQSRKSESARFERKAQEIAEQTYERKLKQQKEAEDKDFEKRLRKNHSDYDQVMNEENLLHLEKSNPDYLRAVLKNPDDYDRRKDTYNFIKKNLKDKEAASVNDRVNENMQNPYYIGGSQGAANAPSAIDFDVSSKSAKEAAYAKLKAAQRRL